MKHKKLNIFLMTLVMFSIFTPIAFAYKYYSGGYETAAMSVRRNTGYYTEFNNATYSWNVTPTPAYIYVWGDSSNIVVDGQYGDTWYGEYEPKLKYIFWGRATSFTIRLNRSNLVNKSSTFRQSTIAHEFGHALCLDDNPGTLSLMEHSRDRTKIYKPQQDDINGVNYAY